MNTLNSPRFAKNIIALLCGLFAVASAQALTVTWNLNPLGQDAPVGSSSHTFVSSGYSITASGYDIDGTPRQLQYKNEPPSGGAGEIGLGLVGTPHEEIGLNPNGAPANFIQLNLTSILAQGFTGGQISVGSVQNGEGFQLFGSDVAGVIGTQLGGTFSGLANDNHFISVPDFGNYDYISIVAASGSVLAVAFQACVVPIPEAASLIPVVCLILGAGALEIRRRRATA